MQTVRLAPGRLPWARALARGVAVMLAVCVIGGGSGPDVSAQSPIDFAFAAYGNGDVDAVARAFERSRDFQMLRLDRPKVLTGWLGAWQPRKAAFLLDIAVAANRVAPARTWLIVDIGRRYVASRAESAAASPADAAFERQWHRVALALLQEHGLVTYAEQYLDALFLREASRTGGGGRDDRWVLARAIAQEQRCWNDRDGLDRSGAVADAFAHQAGAPAPLTGVPKAAILKMHARRQACLEEAARLFDAAAPAADGGGEARVRASWMRFQLGQLDEAHRGIASAQPGDDRDLAYWAGIIHGRIAAALGRHPEAEQAFRRALAASPDAQTAGLGLALTLARLNRSTDADRLAADVRRRSAAVPDPWWQYQAADRRFVDRWMTTLREAAR